MFAVGKTYQIVLNADLDGNTLPFPHTMVGTCLSVDKEYATFLDPMTNIVRGMKVKQGVPKEKNSACKPSPPPKSDAKAVPKSDAKAVPKADAKAVPKDAPAPKADAPAPKADAPAPKADAPAPKADAKEKDNADSKEKDNADAKADAKEKDKPLLTDAVDADVNKRLLKMFNEHLASKETVFKDEFTADLETIKKKNKNEKSIYSITGGFIKNPVKIGLPPADYIKKNYSKDDKTCFFLFNTKQIVDDKYISAEMVFLAALPKDECTKYTDRKPISF